MTPPDFATLMARIHRYYPAGVLPEDPRHWESEESRRHQCVRHACAENIDVQLPSIKPHRRIAIDPEVQQVLDALRAWRPFLASLEKLFPDSKTWDHSTPWHDASYRCYVSQPGYVQGSARDEIVCMVSALAPVYVLFTYELGQGPPTRVRYSQFPERYRDREVKLAALLEDTFAFSRLTESTLLVSVPDVVPAASNRVMGEATIMDCLFTSHL